MTLILTVANSRGVFQSSDFRLTDSQTGRFLSDKAGSKQIEATRSGYQLQLAFTGVASVGAKRTVDWLGEELRSSPADASLEFLCHALAIACRRELKSLAGQHVLSIVLGVATLGKPFQVAELTNEQWEGRRSLPSERFDVRIRSVHKPFVSVAGYKGCLSPEDRMALAALARADLPPEEMMDRLAAINAAAAKRSRGLVSEECWTSAFYGDGHTRRSALKDHGSQSGNVGQQFMAIDTVKLIQENFRAAPGEEVRITPLGGVMVASEGLQPTLPPDTAPQIYRFGIGATSADLHTAAGDVAVRIEISPIACTIVARRNETWKGPIALVRVIPLKSAFPAFPSLMFTPPTMFPSISIDEVDVPNGWRWTVSYWVEDEPKLEILQSSRSIRNIAFLGDDDEICLAAPQGGWRTGWNDLDMKPIEAPIIATVQWKVRPDASVDEMTVQR